MLETWNIELEIETHGTNGSAAFDLLVMKKGYTGALKFTVDVIQWIGPMKVSVIADPVAQSWGGCPDFIELLLDPRNWSVWFETGHSIVEGRLALSDVTIADFGGAVASKFATYDVEQEKPLKKDKHGVETKTIDFKSIGKDKSLFSWWVDTGFLENFKQFKLMQPLDFAVMICDDQAAEVADFVIFAHHDCFASPSNPSKFAVILVHIKAAGKLDASLTLAGRSRKRQMAPKKFEEVLQQGVKNLSVMRLPELSKHFVAKLKAGTKPAWELSGLAFANSLAFGDLLQDTATIQVHLKKFSGSRYHRQVVVVQPHQSLRDFNVAMAVPQPSYKLRLLCTMLNNADAACRAESSNFQVIFSE